VSRLKKNDGFTLIELMIVMAIIVTLASVAISNVGRLRQSANEASAIVSIRAINSAETTYAASCGGGGYATTLTALGLAPAGGVAFISPDLGVANPAIKSGYTVTVMGLSAATTVMAAANTCNAAATDALTGYHVTAVPVTVGTTGQRSFASDNRGTIYQLTTGVAIANPIPAGTQILQ
jgi:type IV pilus assembly protein PilA